MPTDDMTSLRLKRRGTKAKFTRLGNVLDFLIEEKRPVEEVKEAFKQANQAYVDLQSKHEAYTEKIENDEEFNKEELWLDECQNYFCKLQIREKDYISQMSSSQEPQQPTERDEESSQRTVVQAESNRPQAPRVPWICGIASGGGRTPSSMGAILKLVAAIAVVLIGVQTVRVSGKITNPTSSYLLLSHSWPGWSCEFVDHATFNVQQVAIEIAI
eukprot:XP_011674316.1 PREDICTED: uncharacterized protein LOC105443153 [Strongylocentrotus purpuratus]